MKTFVSVLTIYLFTLPVFGQIIEKPIPDKTVVFTFDDATASQYAVAAPLLAKYGFDATFFICEFPPNFSDSTLYMNWRQIGELDKMGFEIANHTQSHRGVSKLSVENLTSELEYIEKKCASMDIEKPRSFAYPGYDLSLSAIATLEAKGYQFARAGGARPYNPLIDHPLLLPSWALEPDNYDEIIAALGEAKSGMVVILTIHGVPDLEHSWVSTSPERFEEYLEFLSKNGYQVISLRKLGEYVNSEEARKILRPDLSKSLKN